jgi:hypothetical protein
MKDISLSDAAAPSRLKMMKDMSPNSKSKLQRDLYVNREH